MRELILLRHAKQERSAAATDFEHPLSAQGRRDAARMGRWLLAQGLVPDHLVASPALRARETTEFLVEAAGFQGVVAWERRIYENTRPALLEVLKNCPTAAARVLLVGHNPALAELLVYLGQRTAPEPEDGNLLPTATAAHLKVHALAAGGATVRTLTRPSSLPETS